MRTIKIASAAVTLLVSSLACTEASAKDARPNLFFASALVESVPEPTPSVAVAPPPAPAVRDQKPTEAPTAPARAGTGFVLQLGSGVGVLAGQIAEGVNMSAVLLTFDIMLGGYVTPHFGIMGGVRAGFGALTDGCANSCTSAFHYQLPVVGEYAFEDRARGLYLQGGLGFLTGYGGSSGTDSKSRPESIRVSSPVDLKLGAGYRFAFPEKGSTKAPTAAFDIHLTADLGTFRALDYSSEDGSVEGEIASDRRAAHYAFGLGFGYHFTP